MNGFGMGDALVTAWGGWMFAMTWQVALFAAIVWSVAKMTGRACAAFRYGLWMLVFVKLILPPTLSADWSIMNLASGYVAPTLSPIVYEEVLKSDTPETKLVIPVNTSAKGEFKEDISPFPVITVPTGNTSLTVAVPFRNRGKILMGIWACGALGLFLMSLVKYQRYVKRVMRDTTPASPELLEELDEQVHAYGLRRKFSLVVSRHVNTPVAFGVRRPKILLPQRALDELTPRQIRFLLGHELAHVKRYDEIAGWGVIVLVCLYWFNPVVWLSTVYLRREREMACDDMVVGNAQQDNKEYASTMVRVAEFYDGTAPAVAGFLGLLGVTDNLMFRVRAVLDHTRHRRAGLRAGVVLALLLLFLAPMGVLTVSSDAQQPPAAQTTPAPATPTPAVPSREALPAEGDRDYRDILKEAVNREIQQYYSKAAPDVQEFIRKEAEQYGPSGQWLPENTFDKLTPEEREKKIKYLEEVLPNPYPYRPNDLALAQAGVLKDKRLLPYVLNAAEANSLGLKAAETNSLGRTAVAALGRIGDESAVPLLVILLDCKAIAERSHGMNIEDVEKMAMWARASLVRITGQDLGAEKKAWEDWWNDVKKKPAFTRERSSTFMKDPRPALLAEQEPVPSQLRRINPTPAPVPAVQSNPAPVPVPAPAIGPQQGASAPEALLQAETDREIQQSYAKADPDVQEYIRWTAKNFGRGGLWLPENAFEKLSAEEREQKVAYIEGVLKGEYGRQLCEVLAQAGALKDKRLLPGVMKAAAYYREDGNYDCRAKWMAVAALGRIGDESAVPLLVSLIDHGNQNTRMWARASLVRITGQNLGTEKKAWGDWWNGAKKQPPITEEQMTPWKAPDKK